MSNPEPSASEVPAPHFRKTKQGKWAVMGPIETLQTALDGDGKVKVLKKNGEWSSFKVVSLGRPFDVDGVQMAYGYDTEGDAEGGSNGPTTGGSRPANSNSGSRSADSSYEQPTDAPSTPPAPTRDEFEPMPEFQGGAEDEWQGGS